MRTLLPVLFVALLAAFVFSGCGNFEGAAAMKQEIERLETKIDDLELRVETLENWYAEEVAEDAAEGEEEEEVTEAKPAEEDKPAETKPAKSGGSEGKPPKGARVK